MKFHFTVEVKIDRQGNVTFGRKSPLYIGRVFKLESGNWSWEIPTQHRTAVLEGRHHEDWSNRVSPRDGMERQRDAVHVLISYHWARGYIRGSLG